MVTLTTSLKLALPFRIQSVRRPVANSWRYSSPPVSVPTLPTSRVETGTEKSRKVSPIGS